jgi:hypothetical protein
MFFQSYTIPHPLTKGFRFTIFSVIAEISELFFSLFNDALDTVEALSLKKT